MKTRLPRSGSIVLVCVIEIGIIEDFISLWDLPFAEHSIKNNDQLPVGFPGVIF
jgi:hypothetical protein